MKLENECVVVDLDGTLLRGNSLREMIKFMLHESLCKFEYGTFIKITVLLSLRKAGLINHRQLKHPIHRISRKWMTKENRLHRFADILNSLINQDVYNLIENIRQKGTKVVIATAAPDIYMPHLLARLSYDEYTATPFMTKLTDYEENRGNNKRRNLEALAKIRGWKITHVITDHVDDIPILMLPVRERILVSPSDELCNKLRNLNLSFNVIS
ncbi:MAG: haloacid dehalogenase-like hydrolase [Muribaculum sp.]|nr:haloacid dehalogenase-like hydrolase [Muribaculum sp.]